MQIEATQKSKAVKEKRRGGLLRNSSRMTKIITFVVAAVTSATFAFTQLGFLGIGSNGSYSAYLILELLPVAVAALLLGPLAGMGIGLFAGTMLLAHAALMPLNYYELSFVTPLTSIVMLGVTGLLLGLLFKFALRHDPGPVKSAIYVTIICAIVSLLYSVGFVINAVISLAFEIASTSSIDSGSSEALTAANNRLTAFVSRMGNLWLQAWVDAALMALSCIIAIVVVNKAKRSKGGMGLRSTFAVRLTVVVVVAFMLTSIGSFAIVSQAELAEAERDMNNEINYLWRQLETSSDNLNTIASIIMDPANSSTLTDEQAADLLKASSANDLLDGYDSEDDGIVLILGVLGPDDKTAAASQPKRYVIGLSDDERFETGKEIDEIAGVDFSAAIEASASSGKVERTIYDEDYGMSIIEREEAGITTVNSEIYYVRAQENDDYCVAMMLPTYKVFSSRAGIMGWTSFSSFTLLAAVFAMVFLLLDRVVARRIDETNGVLARITEGDLNATVDVRDPREFASLSNGVNETVTALKGWIAEAESRIDSELATAKAIQESALPSIFPPFPDILKFDVYASMKAAREVGGDFYDFFLIGDDNDSDSGKLGFIIADVSGKGVPAALFMMKAMTQLRDYLKVGTEVAEAVENANRQLCEGNDEAMFVTVWAGVLDYATGHVEYANAGHNPPLLWQANTGWRWLTEKSGLPLGLYEGLPYESYSVECGIGDQFLLYTDGVTEAMSVEDELYGEDRLEALVTDNHTLHPRMLVNTVRHDVASWAKGAEQSDDITILSLEVGVPPEITATLKLPAVVENLPAVNEFIHSELDRRLCPKRVQNQLDIAVEELFVNVCHYAYPEATPEEPGTVSILRTYSAEPPSVVVDIIDEGIPYNPLDKPDAVTPDNIADVPIGGLGVLMAKKCTDKMSYERSGPYNIVTIVKRW